MIKALIVEDDPKHICTLKDLLIKTSVKVEAVSGFTNIKDAFDGINKFKPDLIFLDIDLDGGESGFDLLKKFETPDFAIIFTTQHNNASNAINAIRACALDFLPKPVYAPELEAALKRFNKNENIQQAITLNQNLQHEENHVVWIRSTDGNTKIEQENIIYCESDNVYTSFYLESPVNKKNKYLSSESIGDWEKIFTKTSIIRIHRSFLVNLKFVTRYKSSLLTLKNDMQLPVPRDRRKYVSKMLKLYNAAF